MRYLVVGGYAVAFHGYPRYTKDLDVWVRVDSHNAEALNRVLTEFGFESLGLSEADFLTPDIVIQLGYPPARIDILTSLSGVEFDAAYERRRDVALDDVTVPFIGLSDLRANKRTLGRHQDLADLEQLAEPPD